MGACPPPEDRGEDEILHREYKRIPDGRKQTHENPVVPVIAGVQ